MSVKMRFGAGSAVPAGATTPASIGAFDLGEGAPLISGQDLNEYKTPGCWYCANRDIAATITNSPTTTAGYKLIVMAIRPDRFVQVCIWNAAACTISIRRWSGSAWGAWKTIAPA